MSLILNFFSRIIKSLFRPVSIFSIIILSWAVCFPLPLHARVATTLIPGDIDSDGCVDGKDLAIFIASLGSSNGTSENYTEELDFDSNASIDAKDAEYFSTAFGRESDGKTVFFLSDGKKEDVEVHAPGTGLDNAVIHPVLLPLASPELISISTLPADTLQEYDQKLSDCTLLFGLSVSSFPGKRETRFSFTHSTNPSQFPDDPVFGIATNLYKDSDGQQLFVFAGMVSIDNALGMFTTKSITAVGLQPRNHLIGFTKQPYVVVSGSVVDSDGAAVNDAIVTAASGITENEVLNSKGAIPQYDMSIGVAGGFMGISNQNGSFTTAFPPTESNLAYFVAFKDDGQLYRLGSQLEVLPQQSPGYTFKLSEPIILEDKKINNEDELYFAVATELCNELREFANDINKIKKHLKQALPPYWLDFDPSPILFEEPGEVKVIKISLRDIITKPITDFLEKTVNVLIKPVSGRISFKFFLDSLSFYVKVLSDGKAEVARIQEDHITLALGTSSIEVPLEAINYGDAKFFAYLDELKFHVDVSYSVDTDFCTGKTSWKGSLKSSLENKSAIGGTSLKVGLTCDHSDGQPYLASQEDKNRDWNGDGVLDNTDKYGDPYGDKIIIWRAGEEHVICDVYYVEPGYKLLLEPGTVVHFEERAQLIVEGEIECNGTMDYPVKLGILGSYKEHKSDVNSAGQIKIYGGSGTINLFLNCHFDCIDFEIDGTSQTFFQNCLIMNLAYSPLWEISGNAIVKILNFDFLISNDDDLSIKCFNQTNLVFEDTSINLNKDHVLYIYGTDNARITVKNLIASAGFTVFGEAEITVENSEVVSIGGEGNSRIYISNTTAKYIFACDDAFLHMSNSICWECQSNLCPYEGSD